MLYRESTRKTFRTKFGDYNFTDEVNCKINIVIINFKISLKMSKIMKEMNTKLVSNASESHKYVVIKYHGQRTENIPAPRSCRHGCNLKNSFNNKNFSEN